MLDAWLREEVQPKIDEILTWDRDPGRGYPMELLVEVVRAAVKPFHFFQQERASSPPAVPPPRTQGAGPGAIKGDEGFWRMMSDVYGVVLESHEGRPIAVTTYQLGRNEWGEAHQRLKEVGAKYVPQRDSSTGKPHWVLA